MIAEKTHTAWLTGIEPDPGAPARGQLVCPRINVWAMSKRERTKIIGNLPHGAQVVISNSARGKDGRRYFLVSSGQIHGWVSSPFISHTAPEVKG